MNARSIIVLGMPSSGKTTYIAAMRHVLLSDETPTLLAMDKMSADEKHLNILQSHWLGLSPFQRTREKSESWVTLHVVNRLSKVGAQVEIPDLRGEIFERPAAFGTCQRQIAEALAEADGILLFTNAEKADDDLMISDYGDADDVDAGIDQSSDASVGVSEQPDGATAVESRGRARFRPDRMPEEAKLVELLQFANRRPRVRRRRRLSVIVSAWDAVIDGGDARSPADWLMAQRPMLYQFLKYNADAWDFRVYGASAQGGKLPRDEMRLKALETASERIIIIGENVARHDPTAPLGWLIASD